MVRMKCNRRGTSIRLDEANDRWLDEEATRTGKSRSDLVNTAVREAADWHKHIEECYEFQNELINMFIDEVRSIHIERKKEHEVQTALLKEIKKLIKNHNDITNP